VLPTDILPLAPVNNSAPKPPDIPNYTPIVQQINVSPGQNTIADNAKEDVAMSEQCSTSRSESWTEPQSPAPTASIDPWSSTNEAESLAFWGISEPEQEACDSSVHHSSPLTTEPVACDNSTSDTIAHKTDSDAMVTDSAETKCTETDDRSASSIMSVDQQIISEPALETVTEVSKQSDTAATADASHRSKPSELNPCPLDKQSPAVLETDPRCLSDHEDGSLFVVNDTDESDLEGRDPMKGDLEGRDPGSGDIEGRDPGSGDLAPRSKRLKWEPAVKRDPFELKETLHLSLEEVGTSV